MDTSDLIQRISVIAQQFNIESEFFLAAPVLMSRAFHPAHRPLVWERTVNVIVSDPLRDHIAIDLSKVIRVLEVDGEIFDLRDNRGWQQILEHQAATELEQARKEYHYDTSLLSVVAYFSDEPVASDPPLVSRALPCLGKVRKALAVRRPRPRVVMPPQRLGALDEVQSICPPQDRDGLAEGLAHAFATRRAELPIEVVLQQVQPAAQDVKLVVQEVAYQSPWLLVREHRVAVEYGQPLRRVSIDVSGAWGAVETSVSSFDPRFDHASVKLGMVRDLPLPIQPPLVDASALADWRPLLARVDQVALDRSTVQASSVRPARRV